MFLKSAGEGGGGQPMTTIEAIRRYQSVVRVVVRCGDKKRVIHTRLLPSGARRPSMREMPTPRRAASPACDRTRSPTAARAPPSFRPAGLSAPVRSDALAESLAGRAGEAARQQRPEARERSLSPGQSIGLPAIIGCQKRRRTGQIRGTEPYTRVKTAAPACKKSKGGGARTKTCLM